MRTKTLLYWSFLTLMLLALVGCEGDEGPAGIDGRDGRDATVYYSEWFSPPAWSGEAGDWYFEAAAPDLTADIVEEGVVLAYAWLAGDLYGGNAVRPLPALAVGANWAFLVYEYGSIEFTCDMIAEPAGSVHYFRFVAIPGTITAAKSTANAQYSEQELRNMSYEEIVELFDIPEL